MPTARRQSALTVTSISVLHASYRVFENCLTSRMVRSLVLDWTPIACVFTHAVVLRHTAVAAPKATRYELYKKIDADYYGYRDEDDGLIVPLEREAEEKGRMISSRDSPW